MPEYCPMCFEKAEFLHVCGESKGAVFGQKMTSEKYSITSVVMVAPLTGVFLDLFLPLPSSLIASVLVAFLGSALTGFLWVAFKYEGTKSFRFFIQNLKNFLNTPNLVKIFGSDNKKNIDSSWIGFIALSTVVQILLFTPGNASFLEKSVNNKIKNDSGINLQVQCPGTHIYLYQDPIECRVKTGVFGITVPARATLSAILGTASIRVSIL